MFWEIQGECDTRVHTKAKIYGLGSAVDPKEGSPMFVKVEFPVQGRTRKICGHICLMEMNQTISTWKGPVPQTM